MALKKMPKAWSSHDRVDQLESAAFSSLSRMLNAAVAKTGVNFNINSAYRSKAEQIALFKKNYRNRGTRRKVVSSDRMYAGTAWRHVTSTAVASPDLYGTGKGANHTRGLAIDIIPGAIQTWIRKYGLAYGWSWAEGKRNGEAWHFVYIASKDRHRSEGFLNHGKVQRAVGAGVDYKIGTGTVKKIKAWQKKHGLAADGIVGPKTKALMLGKADAVGEASAAEATETKAPKAKAKPGWMPGADRSQTYEGNSHKANVRKIVLHTTEGSTLPGYSGGGYAPHFTVFPDGRVYQHISTEQSSKALEHPSGTPETNNAGVIQIEYVGSCDQQYAAKNNLFFTEDATKDDLEGLALVLAWVAEAHNIPLTVSGLDWPVTDAAYSGAGQRFSKQEWADYEGVCGHTHVPYNSHWDPGAFPVQTLLALASGAEVPSGSASAPTTTPSLSGSIPTGKKLLMAMIAAPDFPLLRTSDHLCYYGDKSALESVSGKMPNSLAPGDIFGSGSTSGSHGLKAWQKKAGLTADGRFGSKTKAKAVAVQKAAGLTQDGQIGPDTWYALWLLS